MFNYADLRCSGDRDIIRRRYRLRRWHHRKSRTEGGGSALRPSRLASGEGCRRLVSSMPSTACVLCLVSVHAWSSIGCLKIDPLTRESLTVTESHNGAHHIKKATSRNGDWQRKSPHICYNLCVSPTCSGAVTFFRRFRFGLSLFWLEVWRVPEKSGGYGYPKPARSWGYSRVLLNILWNKY